jgi:hypothetical protein
MPDFTISFNPNNLIQTSLKTLVGGTQELEIFIDDINISSANVLNAHLSFKLYDNFGVDEGDVIKAIDSDFVSGTNVAVGGVLGLKAFWILQHQRGYKPFRTFFHYALNLNDIKL